jgi:hypothetical protein
MPRAGASKQNPRTLCLFSSLWNPSLSVWFFVFVLSVQRLLDGVCLLPRDTLTGACLCYSILEFLNSITVSVVELIGPVNLPPSLFFFFLLDPQTNQLAYHG